MGAMFKRVIGDRRVWSVIGLCVIALLVWLGGDAIAINEHRPLASSAARLSLILGLVLCWVGWEGFKHYRARSANRQMLGALGAGTESNAELSQRELAELKRRFDEALNTLRQARFGDRAGARSYLYQLPWYMFIGAPGSGKTTALMNSGLRFPLAERLGKEAIRGVGGTRNCDWWFTEEAVLLDTAGRYTTQTSNKEVDASAWQGFLGLLKKFRPHQPLNGAIITLSVSDLFTQTPQERADYARSVRARIQELYQKLGVRFPLYVMVTKCDLLAGFAEYFADLGREARAQVWGMTFDYRPQDTGPHTNAQFEREFDDLVQRLNARLLARMEEERDPPRRARLFAFPQQFAALKNNMTAFLDEVFGSSAFSEEPLLRGVYFTSGTQEGTPFDRVLGNISRAYGLERQLLAPAASSGRSYFLTRLLREVVFAESDLAGRTALIERHRNRLALAGYAALGVVTLLLVTGWTVSYVRNQSLVAQVQDAADAVGKQLAALPKAPRGNVLVTLPALDALRGMPGSPASRGDAVPLSQGLGLYQGDKLGSQANRAYRRALQEAFLPRVAFRMEQQIGAATTPEARYEALKAYLMLHDPAHLNQEELSAWVRGDWERTLPREVSPRDRQALGQHLQAALEPDTLSDTPLSVNRALVEDTRRQLASASLAERTYSRLKRQGVDGGNDFRVSEAAGPSAPLLFTRVSGASLAEGVPALFTLQGYENGLKARLPALLQRLADEETWVLGRQSSASGAARTEPAHKEVLRLYLSDYISAWDRLLADLRFVPTNNLQQSIQLMTLLSASDSPLTQLLDAVGKETRLAASNAPPAQGSSAGQVTTKANHAVDSTAGKLLGGGGEGAKSANAASDRPEAQVDRHFAQLHRVLEAPQGASAPLHLMLAVLRDYEVHLRATDEAIKRGAPPPSDAAILARIKSEADRMPLPMNNLLNGLISRSAGQAASGTQAGLLKAVAGDVGVYCKQAVAGRYPFERGRSREVPIGDFARIFGPNGTLDSFLKTRLQGMVDTSGLVWRPVKLAEGVEGIDQANVAQFQRAAVIREAFFPTGSPNPSVSADLVLLRADEGVSEVHLSVDGQTVRLQPGTPGGVRLNWPSMSPGSPIRLSAVLVNGMEALPLVFEGPWALFRLVDAGRRERGSPDRMALSYGLGGMRVLFELRSATVRNPLRLPELAQFRCPG